MNKIEVLAPAGNFDSYIQAINNGADAIYLAGKSFGARASANNFSNDELYEMIRYAHLLGVKIYVTVNTLIKDDEFEDAISFIRDLYLHDVDAIIVQDLGLMDEVIRRFPDLDVHASTQVNVHSLDQAIFLKNLGVKRIILARETPISIIKEICSKVDIEVEVFVHGALCMSYSGNCYLSSIIGGRSGNRGRCAQPCRLLYGLDNHEKAYYLSPKDLMTIDYLNELKKVGVHSLKIEGRMRRPEYVGLAVRAYKEALENGTNDYYKELSLMFNRQFTKGYMFNESNGEFTNINSSNHIGINVGKVVNIDFPYAFIKLDDEVNLGDSIRIVGQVTDAVTISEMYVDGKFCETAGRDEIIKVRVHKEVSLDSEVLKTSDSKLIDEISNTKAKKIPIKGKLIIDNNHLVLQVNDGINYGECRSEVEVQEARNNDFNQRILSQIYKTNETVYYFEDLTPPNIAVFLPIKEINRLRRVALEAIDLARIYRPKRKINDIKTDFFEVEKRRKIFAKVANTNQYEQVINTGTYEILSEENFESENIYHMAPRINIKKGQYNATNNIVNIGNNCLLTGVYLNVFNARTVNLLHRYGVKTVGLSFELSRYEIRDLILAYQRLYNTSPNVMVMVYGRFELMIMKHCLINKAENEKNMFCNKCMEKQYHLVDRKGSRYPLVNDGMCHLRMLSDKVLHLVKYISELDSIGVSNYLLDFSIVEDIKDILEIYLNAFNGQSIIDLSLENTTLGHYKEGIL